MLCDSRDDFDVVLRKHAQSLGLILMWTQDVRPVTDWIKVNPKLIGVGGNLARAVHPDNKVALGPLTAIENPNAEATQQDYLAIAEHDIPPLPDQKDRPFWERDWIAPELKELLFDQPEGEAQLRTYFLVDAALRKNITGVFDLDTIDVPAQCLFQGDTAEELKEAAPWLIDMTLPVGTMEDRDGVLAFHRDFFQQYWDKNTGIFIRSTAFFAEIRSHLRKFTKIQDANGRWLFLRFWDASVLDAVRLLSRQDTFVRDFVGQHRLDLPI
ncbi:DUF4123 domain-containing protein [Martelella mangrovi]|uniref:DUF4123 domain-containing protein n=1 Tax=Martelella mangrovi TaxID=1397477 RepID=A0ABV2IG47_9HYPH